MLQSAADDQPLTTARRDDVAGGLAGKAHIWTLLAVAVTVAWALWPDRSPLTSLLLLLLGSVGCAAAMPRRAFVYTTIAFVVSVASAFLVHGATAPVGHFVTDYQEPLVSDSQYFLYCAQEFNRAPSLETLITTWGSVVPVLVGGLVLQLFHGAYVGIVLANAAMYAISIHIIVRQLEPQADGLFVGALASVLPLQTFYDSMLAKEPIYLLLCSVSVYLVSRIQRKVKVVRNISLLVVVLLVLAFFRPMGAVLLAGVTVWVLLRTGQRTALVSFSVCAVAATISAFVAADVGGVPIPMFFMTVEGTFSLEDQIGFVARSASEKVGVEGWTPWFTPPLSVALAPILAVVWLVAPFPALGPFFDSLANCFSLEFSFQDLALVARAADSIIIVILLGNMLLRRSRSGLRWQDMDSPVLLFTLLSVLAISAFQFVESGRHRYTVTPVLLVFAWSLARRARAH